MGPVIPTPDYVVRLKEVAWGISFVALIMAIHGMGMLAVLWATGAFQRRFERHGNFGPALGRVVLGTWMITAVHLIEVFVWAVFLILIGAIDRNKAYYTALMNYTTLGSEYDLRIDWKLLEGMIGICGLMTFAWSTGVLVTLAQDFQARAFRHRSMPGAAGGEASAASKS